MSYFGTSGPSQSNGWNRSVLAGFQRQHNAIQARNTGLGVIDYTKNAMGNLNKRFDDAMLPKYPPQERIRTAADDFVRHWNANYGPLRSRQRSLRVQRDTLQRNVNQLTELKAVIEIEIAKDPEEIDTQTLQKAQQDGVKLGVRHPYAPNDFANSIVIQSRQLEVANKEYASNEDTLARASATNAANFDKMEDYFVEGPLVNEKKVMGLTTGSLLLGVGGVLLMYYLYKQKPRKVKGSKSAEYAIFG